MNGKKYEKISKITQVYKIMILLNLATTLLVPCLTVGALASHGYIVEFRDTESLERRFGNNDAEREDFYSALTAYGVETEPRFNYTSSIFYGVSFSLLSNTTSDFLFNLIQSLPNIKNVWPNDRLEYPTYVDHGLGSKIQYVLHKRQNSTKSQDVRFNSFKSARVNKIHELGFYGKGVVVGIIDSGVDYKHPAFGGNLGPAYTAIGGYDYTVNPVSKDPMDCGGHGTMVAGVIAGRSNRLLGIAPNAKIRAYKVSDCQKNSLSDSTVMAFTQAYDDGVDVINISMSGPNGWSRSWLSDIASRMVKKGVIVVASAGNAGNMGPFSAKGTASGDDVLSVGSYYADDMASYKAYGISGSGSQFVFQYVPPAGIESSLNGTLYFDALSIDACSLVELQKVSHAGSIPRALLPKGDCDIVLQVKNLRQLGYEHAMFYNSKISSTMYYDEDLKGLPIKIMFAPSSFGQWVLTELNYGNSIRIEFKKGSDPIGQSDTALYPGRMALSSSWGPTLENKFYPKVSAPGGYIYTSTMKSGYKVTSGTSFSAPYVAGIAALFKESVKKRKSTHGNWALEFNSRIMGTSKFTRLWDGAQRFLYAAPTIQQGAGVIDSMSTIFTKTVIKSTPYIELLDTRFRKEQHTIEIYNGNNVAVNYKVWQNRSLSTETLNYYTGVPVNRFPECWINYMPDVKVSELKFTLAPGRSRKVSVTIKAPPNAINGLAFGGKITFTGDNGDIVGVPYMGKL